MGGTDRSYNLLLNQDLSEKDRVIINDCVGDNRCWEPWVYGTLDMKHIIDTFEPNLIVGV